MWAITAYFNSKGDPRRRRNFELFAAALRRQGVPLCTAELCATAEEPGLDPGLSAKHVRVNHPDVLWCKEALLNIALRALPDECEKVCWIDADIEFLDDDWAAQTSALLDTHRVVQPHTAHVFMEEGERPDPDVAEGRRHPSFAVEAARRRQSPEDAFAPPINFHAYHPGHVWAARRGDLERCGGFFDRCVLGHGDIVMATAFFGHLRTIRRLWDRRGVLGTYTRHWSPALRLAAQEWQKRAAAVFERSIGAPSRPLVAYHWFHGTVKSRQYERRGADLTAFDPHLHTALNADGVLTWTKNAPSALRAAVDAYFSQRKQG